MARFGKYEVLGVLGRGGMAEVLKCELSGIGGFRKTFAVKRIHPQRASDPRFVEMLLDEARIAAQLNHPNIVQVLEIDQVDETPYVVMEFIDGPTLNQLLRRAKQSDKWEVPHFLRIISLVCLGLDHAHRATGADGEPLGIVHRDVSPRNIIVSREGTAKLLDFGIAHAADRLSETGVGVLKGKVAYMAPEQARGGAVGPVSDIFAVGCVLYQCVTKRHPFARDNAAAVLRALTAGEFAPPSELAPAACPEELGRIIASTLVTDPAARCPNARALHNWLESYLSSIGYPSGVAPVAGWLRQMYPDGQYAGALEPFVGSSDAAAPNQTAVARPQPRQTAPGSAPSPHVPPPLPTAPGELPASYTIVRQRSRLFWVFAGLLSLAAMAGIVTFVVAPERFGVGAAPSPVATAAANRGSGERAKAERVAETMTTYLDEIEVLTAQRKHALALELLAKARALDVHDAKLDIRLARVGDATEIASFVSLARVALEAGDHDDAVAHAKAALDRDFDNAEARAVLATARALDHPESDHDLAPGELVAARGAMTIAGTEGAIVVVDDEPVGRVPMPRLELPAGEHRLELRLKGYRPQERTVAITAGETRTERVELEPEEAPSSAAVGPRRAARHPRPPTANAAGEPAGGDARLGRAVATEPTATTDVPAVVAAQDAAPKGIAAQAAAASTPAAPTEAATPPVAVPAPSAAPSIAASGPAPASPALAPVPTPTLPATTTLQNVRGLVALFRKVEDQAVSLGGVAPNQVSNCTAPLAKRLIDGYSPGQPLQAYPAGMYYKVVRMARAGKSREAIAGALVRGHLSGTIQSYH